MPSQMKCHCVSPHMCAKSFSEHLSTESCIHDIHTETQTQMLTFMCFCLLLPLQIPIFIYSSACIRYMAYSNWPGFSQEGLLWFQDLTQAAVVMGQQAVQLPMGPPGLILPLAVTGVMLTSIRLGFKASGELA